MACGALRRELDDVLRRRDWAVRVEFLPPDLHMDPEQLSKAIESKLEETRGHFGRVIAVYGRCSPGLDEILGRYGAERLPGEHCYEVLADGRFMTLLREEPGTYFLTNFLCRNFQSVIKGLGLDRYPNLKQVYFRNYKRLVYLDTGLDGSLEEKAREIALYLNLPLQVEAVGTSGLESRLASIIERTGLTPRPAAMESEPLESGRP